MNESETPSTEPAPDAEEQEEGERYEGGDIPEAANGDVPEPVDPSEPSE